MENVSRRGFLGVSAVAGLGLAASGIIASSSAAAEEGVAETGYKICAYDLTPIDPEKVMPAELGQEWHEFKDSCGPLYPGYPHYDEYLDWVEQKLVEYGCVDKLEHTWQMDSYYVNDWPEHDNGCMTLVIDGEEIPVGTNVRLCGDEDHQEATGELMFVDIDTDPETVEEGAYAGKIIVCKPAPMPEPPYTDSFKGTYVITDTNYRSAPEPAVAIGEVCPATENCSWNTRWDFGQWSKPCALVRKGGAEAAVICSTLTWGCLYGLVERQQKRTPQPVICVDRTQEEKVMAAAEAGKTATVTLKAEYLDATNHNFIMFLPGKNYGTDADEYIAFNSHSDAMNLTQDNGALGTLGVIHYFSQIPQEQRGRTIAVCIDTRHFIEGFENGSGFYKGVEFNNFSEHDPYQVYPEVAAKVVASIGVEHMGELEGAEDYEANDIVPTGRPEFSFMKADDNDWCARILIQAATDSGLERADVKVDGRPGNSGEYKGLVRAVQASTHKLGCCVIGEAGNWPGAHTQEYTGLRFFSDKKFHDEVYTWTQVTSNMMDVDQRVFNICWSNLNAAIRNLGAKELITEKQLEGLLLNVSDIFGCACVSKFDQAAARIEAELITNVKAMAPADYDFDQELETSSSMFGATSFAEGQEFLAVVKMAERVVAAMAE